MRHDRAVRAITRGAARPRRSLRMRRLGTGRWPRGRRPSCKLDKPAGVSPVRVSAGAPGSRPRFVVERRRAERGVESLLGGSKHVGRSATRRESCSLVTLTMGEPSRSCHGEGHVRRYWWSGSSAVGSLRGTGSGTCALVSFGTGEARLRSLVSKDRGDKPMVKPHGAQRESDGVVVPLIAVSNAAGGKGPDFGHAGEAGTRKGMAGTARPNHPRGRQVPVNVRRLQNRLWAAAKQSSGRRFHALYDRIHRDDVLWEAWERVRANRGAAGIDEVTVGRWRSTAFIACWVRWPPIFVQVATVRRRCVGWRSPSRTAGCGRWVSRSCVTGWCRRQPSWSSNRSSRPTSCRAVSGSARSGQPPTPPRRSGCRSLEDASSCSRPTSVTSSGRSTTTACWRWWPSGSRTVGCSNWCGDGCVRGCWSMGCGPRRSPGTPQGGVISPLLANIFLHAFDRAWAESGTGELVRYADDFVVLCTSRSQAEQAQQMATAIMGRLGLELHPDKTRVVELRGGREGFDFSGLALSCPHVRPAVGTAAHRALLPASLAVAAVDEPCPSKGQGAHRSAPGRDRVEGRDRRSEPVPAGMGATTSALATRTTSSATSTVT